MQVNAVIADNAGNWRGAALDRTQKTSLDLSRRVDGHELLLTDGSRE
jgi:hypothetical protein